MRIFNQKIIEENERTELGYLGVLKDVLITLWNEKRGSASYTTESKLVKISNKEIYARYNERLKKEFGTGVSPPKFKEHLVELGFTEGLNRKKMKVPTPEESKPKTRLCNIFTHRVLRKLGIQSENNSGIDDTPTSTTKFSLLSRPRWGLCEVCSNSRLLTHSFVLEGQTRYCCSQCTEN